MYYINKNIEQLTRIFDQNSREGYLRLDLNENPGGLPQKFIKSVLEDITPEFVSKYPETLEFTQLLARFLHTDIEHICLVNGSSEGIRNIIEAFSSPNGKIVGVTPTYAMFEVYSHMYGRNFIPIEYTDSLEMPITNIMKELTPEVELLILLNPNNPIGNVYSHDEMAELLEVARKNEITVLIDEAYFYFYSNSFIKYALEEEHVFVTRTFSKLFSLASCRLGYVVGWPEGIKMIQKLCTPHNVNAFGMKFAKAILEKEGMIEQLVTVQREGKQFLIDSLLDHGYEVNAKEGNFVFIKTKTDPDVLVKKMKEEKGILIKKYAGIGTMGCCLRVTTGEKCYMEQFLKALFELDN